MKTLVVAGIGTGVGKTIMSSIIVEALQADYWKPIQAGDLENSDTHIMKSLTSNTKSVFHPEAFRLNTPASPHLAAMRDRVSINVNNLQLPLTNNLLVVELAGGLMVPINDKELNVDAVKHWNAPVVLVSHNYLGSINHTLLSINLLRQHNIQLIGIIFNGEENASTESFIPTYSDTRCLYYLRPLTSINKQTIKQLAGKLEKSWFI